jgi:CheY-like chemotaxis protein
MVVDDNATNREILNHHLQSWGAAGVEACSGAQALTILADTGTPPFGAIVIDMHMPEMDGVDLARTIRDDVRLKHLPILMMSSVSSGVGTAERSCGSPTMWLTKPVRQAQFHTCLASLMADAPIGGATTVHCDRQVGPDAYRSQRLPPRVARVLLVEDNPINQEVAQAMLHELSAQVTGAWNGREALEILTTRQFDVILMDCQMPELDGYEATRSFRRWETANNRARTPVIALTANALSGDEEKCRSAGMDHYLSKPFTMEQLRQALESCA